MIEVVELHCVKSYGPRWVDVEEGDGLVWSSGVFYIVDRIAIDDGNHVTYVLKCVVSSESLNQKFGSCATWNAKKDEPLPDYISLVKSP